MKQATLNLDLDLRAYFEEVVEDTLRGRAQRPDPAIQQYLLGLLEDSALGEGPVRETLGAPLAVQLSDALSAPPNVRFDKLRQLGDGVLLVGGMYESYLRRAGLADGYVIALGQRAYLAASSLMVRSGAEAVIIGESSTDLLARLAESLSRIIALLRDVSDTLVARSAHSARDVARLCERWVDKRSDHLARLLQGHGISPALLASSSN